MKTLKKALYAILFALPALMIGACGNSGEPTPEPEPQPGPEPEPVVIPYSVTNPHAVTYAEGANGFEVAGPFTIYTEDGGTPTLTTLDGGATGKNIPTSYDDLYRAIRIAGLNSTSKNPLQVLDSNYLQVFKRLKKSDNYLFKQKTFYGVAGQKSAKAFCLNNPASYAIDGLGANYYYMSRDDMVKGQSVAEESLETFAGAYNYMFSTNGKGSGFIYATADVHLSECVYCPPTDGDTWNAYIFINIAQGINADLGLIGIFDRGSHVCTWKLVRNCSSNYHATGTSSIEKDARFYVYQDKVATQSTNYNAATGECSGFDDLHFEALGQSWGWTLNVTNLRTGVTQTAVDHHYDGEGHDMTSDANPSLSRALIAASYCPVTLSIWNWDCGAKCEGVTWDHIYLKETLSGEDRDNIVAYRNESVPAYEFYPGCPEYREGYAQGDYRSSHTFGVRDRDGTYPSGIAYHAGEHYLIYNVNYNDKQI